MNRDRQERLSRFAGGGGDSGRPWAIALGLGMLVFMTVWGFGRAAFPEVAEWFLAGGIGAAALAAWLSFRSRRA